MEEGLERGECDLEVGIRRDGEEEKEDTRDGGRDGHGTLPADIRDVDCVTGEDGSRNTDDGRDGIISVGNVIRRSGGFEVLREEGVEQWVAHSDGEPAVPEEGSGYAKLPGVEERSHALAGKGIYLAFDNLHDGKFGIRDDGWITTNLVQDFFGEPGGRLVLISNAMDNCHGFGLTTSGEEELWTLEKMVEGESCKEHDKCHGSHGVDEVSPSLIDSILAATQETPGDQTCDKLANWPPHAQEGQKSSRSIRQEFQEEGSID